MSGAWPEGKYSGQAEGAAQTVAVRSRESVNAAQEFTKCFKLLPSLVFLLLATGKGFNQTTDSQNVKLGRRKTKNTTGYASLCAPHE